jgi:hypothetical protein
VLEDRKTTARAGGAEKETVRLMILCGGRWRRAKVGVGEASEKGGEARKSQIDERKSGMRMLVLSKGTKRRWRWQKGADVCS